jgi:hypothetical protein
MRLMPYPMQLILYNSLLIRINSSPLYIDSSRHDTHFNYSPPKNRLRRALRARDYTLYRLYPLDSLACLPYACACLPARLLALMPYA